MKAVAKVYRHGKACQCLPCVSKRVKSLRERVENMGKWELPSGNEPMVPVRAHWRRQKNYLRKDPALADALRDLFNTLRKKRA